MYFTDILLLLRSNLWANEVLYLLNEAQKMFKKYQKVKQAVTIKVVLDLELDEKKKKKLKTRF